MARIDGERYEYEMNVLLKLRDMGLGVYEVPIETIYINDNAGSHFNPVRDAVKIYMVIFKHLLTYIFSSGLSCVIDVSLYWLFLALGMHRAASNVIARVISSQVNYRMNKNIVFGKGGGRYSMAKYYALCIVQGAISTGLVWWLPTVLPVSAGFVKIPVDIVLFVFSYMIQRDYVFR